MKDRIIRFLKMFSARYVGSAIILISLLSVFSNTANSQITAYTVQGISFGTFYQGNSGGTVDISYTGARSSSGDVVLINAGSSYSQAIFELEAPQGSIISILNGPDINLTGSNGGSISLRIGTADTGSPFVTSAIPPVRNQIKVGGILTIGNSTASPPGIYQGTFSITFHQE